MPPVLDPSDIYAADHAGKLSDAVKGIPERVYVPNSGSDTVDIIDPVTFKIIGHFAWVSSPSMWCLRGISKTSGCSTISETA